ncbi:MAG TPA: cytochrome c oxidase assembly protein [Methyloceanibacter sp.]|nr:cytochrome c oxidase assembly protein [Methyloceanibacter sp.]
MTGDGQHERKSRHGPVALILVGLVACMTGLAFAAVPLYRLFCQATGYGGVPQRAEQAPGEILDRTVRVRFDANVDRALPWSFAPVDRVVEVKIGETGLAFFKASNNSDRPVAGTAVFNVVPELAARYFTKIECFCFKEQTLAPGASVEMPVTFFVDPKLVEDEDTRNIQEITLSYTFYRTGDDAGVAAAPAADKSGS